jgi:LysM repeat protein
MVQIASSDGQTQSQPADAGGHFHFEEMTAGVWQVMLEMPDGWQAVTPATFPITLSGAGSNCASVRFQVESFACLAVSKLEALPGAEPAELPGIAGWGITATLDTQTVTGTTDEQGVVQFANLQPGSWKVSEEARNGWLPAEGYPDTQTIDLVSPKDPGACQQVTFVNQSQYACVDVYKMDSNDGAGLAGWEISIKPSDGGLTIADITDGTGWVRFSELVPGSYTISERPQQGWQAVTPISMTVQLEANGACGLVRFENQPETSPTQLEAAPKEESKKEAEKHGCRAKYRVRAGDTLFRIARRHETSVNRLVRLNRIANPNLIYTGQVLCIP